ncbi:MAG: hypothetical protein C4527_16005 [Candidatus Omnitrophota bacterium]|jgi:hypothetical protein|nr:MAG: hypothetical protein C4527_16005 [Candidatus Omnitrophota bacterium]
MKKLLSKNTTPPSEEMLEEYHFDYEKAKPNRFVGQTDENRIVVILDPDIAAVFKNSDSVNTVLRAIIQTMPRGE